MSVRTKANISLAHGSVRNRRPVVPYTNAQMLVPVDCVYARIPDLALEEFLSYKLAGDSDTKAAAQIGIDVRAIRYWLDEDQRFADAYADALMGVNDTNEDRLMELCRVGSVVALRTWLEAMRPERWARQRPGTGPIAAETTTNVTIITRDEEKALVMRDMPTITIEDANET